MRAAILIPLAMTLLYAAPNTATTLYNRTEYSAAIAALSKSDANAPNLELAGKCWFMLGDFKKATGTLERAAALDPSSSMIQTWLARAWGRRAETAFPLLATGYAVRTRQAFEKALQLDPGNIAALGDLFDFYMDAPALVGGGMDKAAGLLPQFARYDPVGGDLAQARIDEKKKQFDRAEASLRQAIKAAPREVVLVLGLAQFFARRGLDDESEKAFRQASQLAPGAPRILFARAESYIKARRNVDQARDLLKKYLAARNLTPDDPPRWEAARLLSKAGGS